MLNKLNIHLIEYSVSSILRQKRKNIFILTVFTILIFILSSIFFISNSIKHELHTTVESLPEIMVQKMKAGKVYDIQTDAVDEILQITGVEDANARVWGYYFFEKAGVNFTIVGIDEYENQYKDTFTKIVKNSPLSTDDNMLVGIGVKEIMRKHYYNDYFNFIKSDGVIKKVNIQGIFKGETQLESNDIIVITKDNARDIFGLEEHMATDIVVSVKNYEEIPTIVTKIQNMYPNTRIITKDDLKVSYQSIFDYKSGVFLSIFIICLFTFFMIIYDKTSGVTSQEKKKLLYLKLLVGKLKIY